MIDLQGLLSYFTHFAIMAGIYSIFCLGLNIHWGYTGLFNIGIAGFFCIGAYTSALITIPPPTGVYANYVTQVFALNLPFPFGVLGAALVCGIIAFLIGIPTLRLREDYLAIATIGIAETIRLIFHNESWIANGVRGISGIPQPLSSLVDPRNYNFIYLGIVILIMITVYILIERGIRSPWGRVLRAIREDEESASMLGKNIFAFKMQSLIFGAIVMGIGGALFAHYNKSIAPDTFTPLYGTFIIWVMLIVGGSGNSKGAILGGFVIYGLWVLPEFITRYLPVALQSRAPYIRFLIIGIVLELILRYRPRGLMGEEKHVSRLLK
ncbi:MAG: branched-chain amino acid ABC transporter permease [Spirochaetales bacterium]|nr:branched-chain amino acid ABC transporter permease [Spirochaetales bacterium]